MMSLGTIHVVVSKILRWSKLSGKKMMSLSTIHTVVSKCIKMEEAARREDDVSWHNSNSCFKKY